MPRNKRVFPFFLDGGVQDLTGLDGTEVKWNGTSSYIEASGSAATTIKIGIEDSYGRPVEHGTMLVVRKIDNDGTVITVDWDAEFTSTVAAGAGSKSNLKNNSDAVLLLFKGPSSTNNKGEWVNLTSDTFQGGITGGLSVYGSVTLGDAVNDRTHIRGHLMRRLHNVDEDGDGRTISNVQITRNQFIRLKKMKA